MKEPESKDREGLFVETAAYIGTIAAGMLAMWATVRDNCYRNIKKTGVFKEAREIRNQGLAEAAQNAIKNGTSYFDERSKVRGDYRKAIADTYQKLGINNSYDQFREMTKFQKAGVIGIAITICSVGIGAVSSLAHRRKISMQLEKMDREQHPDQGQIR